MQEKYRAFVKEGIGKPGPWDDLRGQILLGDDEFASEIELFLKQAKEVKDVPRKQRFANRPGLEGLFEDIGDKPKELRNRMIREAHLRYGYTLVEIGKVLGLHYSTISKIMVEDNSQSKT